MNRLTRKALPLAIGISASLSGTLAQAQLEEVVITAQKKAESLQDAPLSVAAFGSEALEAQGINNLGDLAIQSPSLQSVDFPTATSNIAIFIRGFGNTDSQTLTIDNPVGIYIDGVYVARTTGATLDVLDLERVEILRGPQGTLFGRNSSAGAVSFISKRPAEEFEATVEAGIGNFGAWNTGASVDLPITKELRTKLSVNTSSIDGWVENKGPNSVGSSPAEDFYEKEQLGYRLAVAWEPSDNLTIDYIFDNSEMDSTAPYFQADPNNREKETTNVLVGGPYRIILPKSDNSQFGHNLTATWDISDDMTLKSITGYREMEEYAAQNWSNTFILAATALDWSTEAFSQELQLLGKIGERLDYILGLYYFEEEGEKSEEGWINVGYLTGGTDALSQPEASTSILLGGNSQGIRTIDTDLESRAIFAQATYTPDILDSRLSLTGGLRYTEDEREATRGVDPSNPSITHAPGSNAVEYDRVDYSFAVDYALSEDASVYFRTATGYRAGGSGERTVDFSLTFNEEDNVSYEVGLKSEWLDRRLRVNAAAFTTEYNDLVVLFEGLPPDFIFYLENLNAGEATVDGLELDVEALVGENTSLSLNYTYLDSEVNDVVVPQESILLSGPPFGPTDLRGTDLSGSVFLPIAPENAYSLSVDHSIPMASGAHIDLNLNYVWRDDVYATGGGVELGDYGQLGARVALSDWEVGNTSLTVSLWGKNLTDEEEATYNLANLAYQFSTPRTYGLDVKARF